MRSDPRNQVAMGAGARGMVCGAKDFSAWVPVCSRCPTRTVPPHEVCPHLVGRRRDATRAPIRGSRTSESGHCAFQLQLWPSCRKSRGFDGRAPGAVCMRAADLANPEPDAGRGGSGPPSRRG